MGPCSRSTRPTWPAWGLIAIALLWATPAAAQTAGLGPCTGQAGSRAEKKIRLQLQRALRGLGIKLVSPAAYLRAAKREKVDRQAHTPQAVAKLAPVLSLDGVVTCTITRERRRYVFRFEILGPDGGRLDEVRLRNKKPILGRPGIARVAAAARAALSGGAPASADDALAVPDDIALIPLVPVIAEDPVIKPTAIATAASDGAVDGSTVKAQPLPMELALKKPAPAPGAKGVAPLTSAPTGEVVQQAQPKPGEPKSVPEVWVAAGASAHLRAGLNPRYQAGPFPGFRVEGRAFLGSLIDMPGLEDLGLEFAYDRGIGLTYSSAFRPDEIDAYEQHWRVGVVYRLSFEQVLLGPAVLFRIGYGGTTNGVDQAYPDLVSAGYSHLDLIVDAHAWIVRPVFKATLSAGWVAMVLPGESLSGSGMGLTFGGGLEVELIAALHLSAGYEQWQFVFDEDAMGKTSDRFQMLFVRVGWTYR